MKNFRISFKAILLLLCLSLTTATIVYADPIDEDDPENTPIDGGASLLIGAAVIYGAKKLKDRKDKLKEK